MSEDFNNIFIGKLEDEEQNQDLSDTESEMMNTSPLQVRVNLFYMYIIQTDLRIKTSMKL
mgnify:CR=1 FL=1